MFVVVYARDIAESIGESCSDVDSLESPTNSDGESDDSSVQSEFVQYGFRLSKEGNFLALLHLRGRR